jgi:MFS superfamily sulfate permease-like transporter
MELGYHMVIGVILFVGVLQLILTWAKAAKFSYLFPSAAIQGMLSSIGFMLIAKQIPNFIGHPYKAHEFWGMVFETPTEMVHIQPQVFAISAICLALLFILPKLRIPRLNALPPQLIVVVVAVAFGMAWHLDPKYLVVVPSNLLAHGFVAPDFSALFADPAQVASIAIAILTLTFVDGTESLATILAVDKIDPWHRKSSPDRTLFAMGISNICSSLIGGLTIIPGIIKSTTCIHSGGRTAWVNFYNAAFLIIFLLLASSIIKMIPLGALAAVLVHIGWKLAGPHKWRYMWSMGSEQTFVYAVTILVTVSTDLLVGILAGIILKFALLVFYNSRAAASGFNFSSIVSLMSNPIDATQFGDDATKIEVSGPVVCFNSLYLRSACDKAFAHRKPIKMRILPSVNVVDHSSSTFLQTFKQDCTRAGIPFSIEGLEALKARTSESASLKFRLTPAALAIRGLQMVLAIDDSAHSRVAVEEIKQTPWPKESKLVVVTVLNVPFGMALSEQHKEKAAALVQGVVEQIQAANPSLENIESLVLKGDVKSELYSLIRKNRVDLLVTGTRTHKRMESVSHALLLSAHCSVRICRAKKSDEGKHKVILALDESRFSMNALQQIAARPWPLGTEFVCVSAIPTLSECLKECPDWYQIEDLELNRNKQVQTAQRVLDAAVATLTEQVPNCTASCKVVDGDPRESILNLAENEKADLIVLGSAGKNFAERLVVGSVSEAIAVWANCSVEVIEVMPLANSFGFGGRAEASH